MSCSNPKTQIPAGKVHLFLIAGQSNTHSGIGYNAELDTAASAVFQLGRKGEDNHQILPVHGPLQHHTAYGKRIGFGIHFANHYVNQLEEPTSVVLIPCGHGGSGFSDNRWNKGNDLYEDAVSRVLHLKKEYPNAELKAMLWHQGEKDIGNEKYPIQLDRFINDIRLDVGDTNLPVILGGMVPDWVALKSTRTVIEEIIATTPNRIANTGYVNPSIPFVIQREDVSKERFHFDAKGQRELGKRYFKTYMNVITDETDKRL